MARIRTIKPEFFTDEDVCDLPPLVRLFFAGMWCHSDKSGRLHDKPRELKARIMPYDDLDPDVTIVQLVDSGFLVRYTVEDKSYLQVRTWVTHQRPHHTEKDSDIPPCNNGEVTVKKPSDNGRKGREGKGKEGKGRNSSCRNLRFDEEDMETAQWMFSKIREINPDQKEPNYGGWANELRLIRERDGRTDAQVRELFGWANQDEFWRANILSPAKLRKQWDQLTIKQTGLPGEQGTDKCRPPTDEELASWTGE